MSVAGKKKKIFDDRYEIASIVGRGAQSVVYRARHIDGDRHEVALKVLLKPKSSKISGSDLLRKEALAMVSSRHKYVIRLDDFHSVDDLCYLSMEYAPEADLRKYTNKLGGELPLDLAERFLSQVAEAMNFIHLAGILHRDIKPDNILVMDENSTRLGDFGVAVLPGEESSLEELQNGVGTMDYMAPEVLAGTGYDPRSDIYALGVVFYELIAKAHPFENTPLAQQLNVRKGGAFPALQEVNPKVPAYLNTVIMRAMAYDPNSRYQTARELLQELKKTREESGFAKPTGATPSTPEKPPARSKSEPQPESRPAPAPKKAPIAEQMVPAQADPEPASAPFDPLAVTDQPPAPKPAQKVEATPDTKVETSPSQIESDASEDDEARDPLGDAVETSPKSLRRKRKKRRSHRGIRSTRQGVAQDAEEDQEESLAPESEIILAEPPEHTSSGKTKVAASSPSLSPAAAHQGPGLRLGQQVAQSAFAAESSDDPAEVVATQQSSYDPIPVVEPAAAPDQGGSQSVIEPEVVVEPKQHTPPASVMPEQGSASRYEKTDSRPNRAFTAAAFASGATGLEEPFDPLANRGTSGSDSPPSAERSVKSKRKSAAKRTRSAAPRRKGGFNPVLAAGAVLLILYFAYPRLLSMFNTPESVEEAIVVETKTTAPPVFSESAEPIRAEGLNLDNFPLIPSGVYGGMLSGVVPGRSTPITVIALIENDALTVILGIPGWTPVTFSYEELRSEFARTSANRLKLASNGLVLEMVGEAKNGELVGELKNITTGDTGQWSLVPIR